MAVLGVHIDSQLTTKHHSGAGPQQVHALSHLAPQLATKVEGVLLIAQPVLCLG